jgi:hypothetical protein
VRKSTNNIKKAPAMTHSTSSLPIKFDQGD